MATIAGGLGGTLPPVPVFRPTARVIIADADGRVLLFGGPAPASGTARAWITPGGGVRAGESLEQAAARELAEETGHVVAPGSLGPVVASCAGLWRGGQQLFFAADSFFLVRVTALDVDDSRHEPQERTFLAVYRWWTGAELIRTSDQVVPAGLAGLLRVLLTQGVPARPVRLPWSAATALSQ